MELKEIAQQLVAYAKQAGADEAEAIARSGSECSTKVRLGKIEAMKEARSNAVGLRVFYEKRAANTYTSDFSADALKRFAEDAVALAKLGEADEFHSLPEGPFADTSTLPDLHLYDEAVEHLSPQERLARALAAEAAVFEDERITNSDGATFDCGFGEGAFANSAGFVGSYRGSHFSLSVQAIADDKDGKKQNAVDWSSARFLSTLRDSRDIGLGAAAKALRKLGASKVNTCSAPVIFEADAGRALLSLLLSTVSGSSIFRKNSYLVDRERTAIASPLVTLIDNPHLVRGHGSRPYDGDGLATKQNLVVEDGVLRTYLCDTYAARKLGRASTASASRSVSGATGVSASNFYMLPGQSRTEDIIANTQSGLYVTEMMGFGFNPVTGDFSRGAAGFWVENGKLSHPVAEITISANFDELWKRIDMVGDELVFKSSLCCPMFRVSEMTIAGK